LDWIKKTKAHTDQAVHNEELLRKVQAIPGNSFPDWRITAIFYVCVHCVDALLAMQNIRVHNHYERRYQVTVRLKPIAKDYFRIEWESRRSRYDPDYRLTVNEGRIQAFETRMRSIKATVPIP
jgi:hypothetical protein